MEIKQFIATKAFVVYQGKVLLLRESSKYSDGSNLAKYDLPGGRLKPGEHFKEALLREVKEETGLTIEVKKPFFVSEWRPVVSGEQWQIVGVFFECFSKTDQVILSEDHDDYFWLDPKNYFKQDNIIKNLLPVFEEYLKKNLD